MPLQKEEVSASFRSTGWSTHGEHQGATVTGSGYCVGEANARVEPMFRVKLSYTTHSLPSVPVMMTNRMIL